MPTTNRNQCNEKGLVFSFDLLAAFLGICLISLVSIESLARIQERNQAQLSSFETEKNALMLVDSMIKNRDETNPSLGATVFDGEKHRVSENTIDKQLLKEADPLVGNFFLEQVEIEYQNGFKETVFSSGKGTGCIAVARFVLIEGKKALLKAKVCPV